MWGTGVTLFLLRKLQHNIFNFQNIIATIFNVIVFKRFSLYFKLIDDRKRNTKTNLMFNESLHLALSKSFLHYKNYE